MGRKVSDKYNIKNLITKLEEYINNTELPIFKEFCYKNDLDSDYVYSLSARDGNEDLSSAIKKLRSKKETELEQGGLTGKYKTAMAIFSLKQLGWKDTIELEQSTAEDKSIKIEMKSPTEDDIKRVKELKERLFKQ